MKNKWISTKHAGVRFREHESRKHGIGLDRYFSIRYRIDGKLKEEGLGWASEGWTAEKAMLTRAELRQAATKGEGPRTLAEKREIADQARQEQERQTALEKSEGITFGQVWTRYEAEQGHKSARSMAREVELNRIWIDPVIGSKAMRDICPLDLERIKKNMLDAGRAPRSAQYMLAVVRQVFNFAEVHDLYLGVNPTKRVKVKIGDNRRQRFLSQEEADELLSACRERSQDVHDLCLLSLHTGMRAGECFALEWRDVDFGQGILTLRNTKNSMTRHAYMTEAVKDMLRARRQTATTDMVFNGRPEVSDTFNRVVEALGLNRGISDRSQKIVFHTLRHTFASWLAMQGTPIFTIAKLMGHKTTAMSERYSHLSPGHLQDAVRGFEANLGKPKVIDIATGRK
ncbi:MAG: site-specific integrase [Deltaproteobacteria bacterium]|nr:site-specific integrase [Deltaproteobacteria bacterium]